MIDETLNELNNTNGVIGTFIANMDGHVVARTGKIKAIPFKSMASEIKTFLGNIKLKGTPLPKRLQFTYHDMIIMIQILDFGFVVVLCESDNKTALLRLTLDVLFSKVKNNKSLKKYSNNKTKF